MQHESDRSSAIVSSALTEDINARAICNRLIPVSNTHYDNLFGDKGPLGTFSAKIEMGYSLGLYGPIAKGDLHKIRKIRNEFAHELGIDFGHEKIVKICKTITDYPRDDLDVAAAEVAKKPSVKIATRIKFGITVMYLSRRILREGRIVRAPPAPTQSA